MKFHFPPTFELLVIVAAVSHGCGSSHRHWKADSTTDQPQPNSARTVGSPAERSPAPAAKTDVPAGFRYEVQEEKHVDGTPKSREEFLVDDEGNYIPHGVREDWWEDGKAKKLEMHYVNGLEHGPKISWFRDGRKWSEGEFIEGKEHGVWIIWYPNGQKQHEIHIDHGAWHGTETQWHENGRKRMQGEWDRGKQKGFFTYWDENGKITHEIDYGNPSP